MTADRCSAERGAPIVATARGALVVDAARSWIGTPYRHQASCRGAGADCLGLVRGVWRTVMGAEPEAVPAYTADWAEAGSGERLMAAATHWLVAVAPAETAPGDVLLFRMRERGVAKHLAILSEGTVRAGRIVHAYSGHAVCETALTPAWGRRLAGAFRFPGED